jgi:hypothetical protein
MFTSHLQQRQCVLGCVLVCLSYCSIVLCVLGCASSSQSCRLSFSLAWLATDVGVGAAVVPGVSAPISSSFSNSRGGGSSGGVRSLRAHLPARSLRARPPPYSATVVTVAAVVVSGVSAPVSSLFTWGWQQWWCQESPRRLLYKQQTWG